MITIAIIVGLWSIAGFIIFIELDRQKILDFRKDKDVYTAVVLCGPIIWFLALLAFIIAGILIWKSRRNK